MTINKTYKITFPNDKSCVAKYVEEMTYPSSGMPPDYIFEGISGTYPTHETMHPRFPLPAFLISQTKFEEIDAVETETVEETLESLVDKYNSLGSNDSAEADRLSIKMGDLVDKNNKHLVIKAYENRLTMLNC